MHQGHPRNTWTTAVMSRPLPLDPAPNHSHQAVVHHNNSMLNMAVPQHPHFNITNVNIPRDMEMVRHSQEASHRQEVTKCLVVTLLALYYVKCWEINFLNCQRGTKGNLTLFTLHHNSRLILQHISKSYGSKTRHITFLRFYYFKQNK